MEALVTLAIGSLLLGLLFSLTSQFVDQGFRLGNRALAQAERFPGRESLAMVLDSLILPGGGFGLDGPDTSFLGTPSELAAMSLAARSTRCGPAGYRKVTLLIEDDENQWSLTCRQDDQEAAVLASGAGDPPHFAFSVEDGEWVGSAEVLSPQDPSARGRSGLAGLAATAPTELRIRLVDAQGRALLAGIAERPRIVARPFNPAADE